MEKKRDTTFDLVKFIAMFMVVYSHVISYRQGFDLVTMPSFAMNFIQLINMPLFFIISGYFSRRLQVTGDWMRLANRLVRYFWPLAFFGVFFAALDCFAFCKITVSAIPLVSVKRFLFTGWFFYALGICDTVTFVACKIGRSWSGIFLVCLSAFLILVMSIGRMWYAQYTVAMIPFYWFGLWALPRIQNKWKNNGGVAMIMSFGVIVLVVTFFLGNIATNGLSFYMNSFDIFNPNMKAVLLMFARYALGIVGSLFVVKVVALSVKFLPSLAVISFLGTETLGIYFLQGNIVQDIATRFIGLNADVFVIFMTSLFVFMLSFFIVKITKLNHFTKIVIWGKTLIRDTRIQRKGVVNVAE